jgi:hypothetical protein
VGFVLAALVLGLLTDEPAGALPSPRKAPAGSRSQSPKEGPSPASPGGGGSRRGCCHVLTSHCRRLHSPRLPIDPYIRMLVAEQSEV